VLGGLKRTYPDATALFLACALHIIGIRWICDELLAAVVGISRIMHGLDKKIADLDISWLWGAKTMK
jgi:hypothetical protein